MELPIITVVLLNLALILFIGNELNKAFGDRLQYRLKRVLHEFEKIHSDAAKQIDDLSFDLYWSNVSDAVKANLMTRVVIPEEIKDMIPTEAIDDLIDPRLREIRGIARHVALHALIGDKERTFLKTVPRRIREELAEVIDEHERNLDQQCTALIDVGIDVSALQAHFSVS